MGDKLKRADQWLFTRVESIYILGSQIDQNVDSLWHLGRQPMRVSLYRIDL